MNLAEMRGAYIDDGYGYEAASTRSCQDAFLVVVASSAFADKVTFKGGDLGRKAGLAQGGFGEGRGVGRNAGQGRRPHVGSGGRTS